MAENIGPGITPQGMNVAGAFAPPIAPPATQSDTTPPAEQGLSGGDVNGPAQQTVAGPAAPHQNLALHILDALGGANPSDPMAWAKSSLAGTLAAGANVGKTPPGGGFLYGLTRGAQGVQEQRRQQMLDVQNAQRQQQEMQLKQNADVRAEKELQNATDRTKAEIGTYTAQRLRIEQQTNQAAELEPYLVAGEKLKLDDMIDAKQKIHLQDLALLKRYANISDEEMDQFEHFTDTKNVPQATIQQAGSGQIFPLHNGEKATAGNDAVGNHVIPASKWDTPITADTKVITGYEQKKDGTFDFNKPVYTTVSAGHTLGDIYAVSLATEGKIQDAMNHLTEEAKLKQTEAETSKNYAEAGKAGAEAELARSQVGLGGVQKDILGGTYTPPAGGMKETNKIHDSFKKDADNLAKTEGTYNQFQDILNDINSGKGMTGAQSVVALFNAIGISAEPLQGKGFRINHNIVEEHAEARGLGESLYQKFLKLKKGDVITPQQVKDYAEIALRSRHDAYVNKIDEVRAQGVDPTFLLPRGNGKHIDTNTAKIFFDSAGGNTPQEKATNALAAAKATGWQ